MLSRQAANTQLADVSCSLVMLSSDWKRILKMQFKEFIHHLDDAQENRRRNSSWLMNKSLPSSSILGYS